ncbi:hypothetical protein CDAR_575271 [Caerostris darwini]|uniref:Ribosomal protein S14 n=1 Tax=Caerostris darwini TaxID=1538125 RepID=A0AAV4MVZ9_9ARAC|nr:hypothetical protein CDAR_575271 [Caerostris darwini]
MIPVYMITGRNKLELSNPLLKRSGYFSSLLSSTKTCHLKVSVLQINGSVHSLAFCIFHCSQAKAIRKCLQLGILDAARCGRHSARIGFPHCLNTVVGAKEKRSFAREGRVAERRKVS